MVNTSSLPIKERLQSLTNHLKRENPLLLEVVKSFRKLDKIAYRLGLLDQEQSFATHVPWWPLIAVLGTYSSGKSTFINTYLRHKLQSTGNQAVDDKFTVVSFSSDQTSRTLPGLALDADPRFPFYQISQDIERVASGEGVRVDSYLQLKTCPSEDLRGKILIDSPGFDADDQRTATLRIIEHIIDLSDLVLVFFDARHPEPGAMQDTLDHLVANAIHRSDSNKFLYILNQIDNAAREDNPEEVFAAWQRALAQKGLTAGRFYRIYDPSAAIPIEDNNLRTRFESKREIDLSEIHRRMEQVEVERAYRITGVLEKTAKSIENELVPRIRNAKEMWKRRVLWFDGIAFGVIVTGLFLLSVYLNYWDGIRFSPPWLDSLSGSSRLLWFVIGGMALLAACLHFYLRRLAAQTVVTRLKRESARNDEREWLVRAFLKNVRAWRSLFRVEPIGWGRRAKTRLTEILNDANRYVQMLNDRFTNPSGEAALSVKQDPVAASQEHTLQTDRASIAPNDSRETTNPNEAGESDGIDENAKNLKAAGN